MKNPWTKKNPLLSMWLSGANAVAGATRGQAAAASKRQAASLMSQSARQMTRFWIGALGTSATSRKKKQR